MSETLAYFSAYSLWPQLTLASGVMVCLAAGMVRDISTAALRVIGVCTLVVALWMLMFTTTGPGGALLHLDGLGLAWQVLFYAGAFPVVLSLAEEDEVPLTLILGTCLGAGLIAVSGSLFMLFVGLEFMSLPAYLLVARLRNPTAPKYEAAVKYFFAGAMAGGLFLLGMAFHYAATGSFALAPASGLLGQAALVLMGVAALFKIGSFPFHWWLPDVYEASQPPLAGFMSTSVKAAAVFLLMRLVSISPESALSHCLPWAGAVTALYGALLALRQERLQRLLAYSSVSHAGILIFGVGAWAAQGCVGTAAAPLFFYGLVYLFMSNGAFLFLRASGLAKRGETVGYGKLCPTGALLFATLLLALAGIPPTGGFLAKFFIFWEAAKAGLYVPLALTALAALLGLGYYLGLIRNMYFEEPKWRAPELEGGVVRALLWVCAAAAALLGAVPWVFSRFAEGFFR